MTSPQPSKVLGRNVCFMRMEQGWSFEVFVQRLGWPTEDVTELEGGRLDATLDQLDHLAAVLSVAPHELLGGAPKGLMQVPQKRAG